MDKEFSADDKGYKAAKQDVVAVGNKSDYERGLNDAWECAGKMERLLLLHSDVFLEAYEMTGLTPAQVGELQKQYDEAVAELKKWQPEEE